MCGVDPAPTQTSWCAKNDVSISVCATAAAGTASAATTCCPPCRDRPEDATVVVSYFDDPSQLHVRFLTQQRRACSRSSSRGSRRRDRADPRARRWRTSCCSCSARAAAAAAARANAAELLTRLPLGYAVGIAAGGILVAAPRAGARAGRAVGLPLLGGGLARARAAALRGAPAAERRAPRGRTLRRFALLGVARACSAYRRAALRRQAAARVGRLGDLGHARADAVRVRPSRRARLHRPELPGAAVPAAAARARGGRRSASWAGSTGRSSTCSCSASRSRSSAGRGCCCASTRRRSCSPATLLAVVTAPRSSTSCRRTSPTSRWRC